MVRRAAPEYEPEIFASCAWQIGQRHGCSANPPGLASGCAIATGGPWMTAQRARLGSAEESILGELRRIGGPVPRQLLVKRVHEAAASSRRRRPGLTEARAFKNAESTLSRALRSLERKKLVVRTYSRATRQTLVSLIDSPTPPPWEQEAQREEMFAARCDAASTELIQLARRARRRASRLRMERSITATARERESDRARWRQLLPPPSL